VLESATGARSGLHPEPPGLTCPWRSEETMIEAWLEGFADELIVLSWFQTRLVRRVWLAVKITAMELHTRGC